MTLADLSFIDEELVRRGVDPQKAQALLSFTGGRGYDPNSTAYKTMVGATSQPQLPGASFLKRPPEEATAPDIRMQQTQPALSFTNAQPPKPAEPRLSFADRFQAEQVKGQQETARLQNAADTTKPSLTRKLMAVAAGVLGGVPRGQQVWNAPRAEAQQKVTQAQEQTNENLAGIAKEANLENVQSEMRERDLRSDAIEKELNKPETPEHQDIVKEFSDALAKGDQTRIDALGPRVKQYLETTQKQPAQKHSPGEVKLDEGIPTGIYGENDKLWRANDPAMPTQLKAALADANKAHGQKVQEQKDVAASGRAIIAGSKAINMIKPDGTMIAVNGEDLPKFMKDNPGSVEASAGASTQAMGKQALISDIRRSANEVRKNLDVLDRKGFDYVKLASALGDPNGTIDQYLQSIPRNSLDDKGQQFVSDLFSLREQAMAMRSVLGAGQGSEDVRRAILSTLPGISSGSKGFGEKQINNLLAALNTLEKGVPKVGTQAQSEKTWNPKMGRYE